MIGSRGARRQTAGTPVPRREEGVALIVVIGIAAVLTVLVTAALSVSLGGLVKARTDQDWNAAMAAAYAGVDDYKSKLANDNTYMQYGNPDSPFSAASKAAGTLALPTGSASNPAFGLGPAGSWATLPGSGGTASYRYEVDNSNYWATGVLRLQSTGRVGKQTRSIVVNLKQAGFIDFLYFTNYELQDPALTGKPASCVMYKWQGRSDTCGSIQFGSSDVINGPLHSNDTLLICDKATFNGPVTTANNTSPIYLSAPSSTGCSTSSSPNFNVAGSPAYSPIVAMPPSNAKMKDETRTDIPALVPRPGCLYTGPTSIVFNADGTMTVRSPWTKATRVVGNPATAVGIPPTGSSSCGTPGDPAKTLAQNANTLAGATGQVITVPAKNLIYVQNVPSSAGDPNYWPSASTPPELSCTGLTGSSGAGNGIGYPTTNEYAPTATSGTQAYGCRNGDAFVEGQLHSAVTISAANYLYVTRNITYLDPKADILGLVAENAVWVWNPMKCTTNCSSMSNTPLLNDSVKDNGRTINAAILSVNHTFQVQNYDKGNLRGTLTISGAIAQNFRGPVGTSGSTGYAKGYLYDQRFRNIAPPKFMVPVSTTYGVSVQVEVGKAFNPDGSAG